jgi:hypothetical protein
MQETQDYNQIMKIENSGMRNQRKMAINDSRLIIASIKKGKIAAATA